jgi:hypothetical protein
MANLGSARAKGLLGMWGTGISCIYYANGTSCIYYANRIQLHLLRLWDQLHLSAYGISCIYYATRISCIY